LYSEGRKLICLSFSPPYFLRKENIMEDHIVDLAFEIKFSVEVSFLLRRSLIVRVIFFIFSLLVRYG